MIYDMREWEDFDRWSYVINKYMLPRGEGETMASQTVTACNTIVYEWYNNGGMFDTSCRVMRPWNDISDRANWLYEHHGWAIKAILSSVSDVKNFRDYTDLIYALCEVALDEYYLRDLAKRPKEGSIYECSGRFSCEDYEDDYDDDYDEDGEDDEDDYGI